VTFPTLEVTGFSTTRRRALLSGLCPRCRSGRIFAGLLDMHPRCPTCALQFEREPGYFTGAVCLSFLFGLPLMTLLCAASASWWGPDSSLPGAVLPAVLALAVGAPILCRWSRILWIHLDRGLDPGRVQRRPLRRRSRRDAAKGATIDRLERPERSRTA
jgi:uncharacterized protein (DUF983 family)